MARGEPKPNSDIDILEVIIDLPQDMGLRFREANRVFVQITEGEGYRRLGETG